MSENRCPKSVPLSHGTPSYVQKVFKLKKQGMSIREIAFVVGISKSKVHRVLHETEVPTGVSHSRFPFEIHNYQVRTDIVGKPEKWNPNLLLSIRGVEFSVKAQGTNLEKRVFGYGDCSVHLSNKSATIYPPPLRSNISANDAKAMASDVVLRFIPDLEKLLGVRLRATQISFFPVQRQHAVLHNDKLWDYLRSMGFSKVEDAEGDVRLVLDFSKGVKHIESPHKVFAQDDIDNFSRHVLSMCEGGPTISEVYSHLSRQTAVMSEFAEEFRKHSAVLDRMLVAQEEQTAFFRKLNKRVSQSSLKKWF